MNNLNSFIFYLKQQTLRFRNYLVTCLVGKDPVVMNIYLTSDIVDYNKLGQNKRAIFSNNKIKTVSSRQSFVLDPRSLTTNTRY